MREIKFRAWLKKENRMIDPVTGIDLTAPYATVQWFDNVHDALENKVSDCWMEDCELMQYTGLKDKNGKEVFEGDLLRRTYNPDDEWEKVNYVAYEVFFHDNDCADKHIGFQMNRVHFQGSICGTSDFINFLPKNVKNLEVIGNIYENLELVKS